jgi:hypothetical protein
MVVLVPAKKDSEVACLVNPFVRRGNVEPCAPDLRLVEITTFATRVQAGSEWSGKNPKERFANALASAKSDTLPVAPQAPRHIEEFIESSGLR